MASETEKQVCWGKFMQAMNTGKLKRPDRCEVCRSPSSKVSGHHEDYSKPFDVVWICGSCHRKLHRLKGRISSALALRIKERSDPAFLSLKDRDRPNSAQVKEARLQKKLSQAEAAQMAGLSVRTWQYYESGKLTMHSSIYKQFLMEDA